MGTLANAIRVLGVLSMTLEAVPVVGSNLKIAADLASKICDTVQNIKDNRKSYEHLALHIEQLLVAISSALQRTREERLGAMAANVERLMKVLEEVQVAIHDRSRSETPSPVGACDRLSTWLCNTMTDATHASADEDNVKEMRRKLEEVMAEFDVGAHMRTEIRVENVETLVRLAVEHMSRLEAHVQANNEHAKLEEEFRFKSERIAENNLLDTLKPISSATWEADTSGGCTPDTRVVLLDEIMSWVHDPAGSCVFWLNGLAGTGKSTIARTLCQRLSESALLGANFFVSRKYQDHRNSSNIVRSLAHQLALQERKVASALCSVLLEKPMSASRSLESQIKDFLAKPAGALGGASSLVIVVDALDECLPEGDNLLLLLVRHLIGLSGRLKLFVTSRAEPSIQQMFHRLTTHSQHAVIRLHDLDKTMVQQDIRTYFLSAFRQIRVERTSLNLCDWPLAEDLEGIVEASGMLFIYAATVMRFVGNRQHSPRNRLAQVLAQEQASSLTKPYAALDKLYRQILVDAIRSADEDEDEGEGEDEACDALCQRLRDVLAVVVLVQTPVDTGAVAVLAGQRRDDAHIAVSVLSALLLVDSQETVRIFHPSFSDFITDASRCTMDSLRVSPSVDHGVLALRCLSIMNQTLHYDMCDIQNPAMANEEVPHLAGRLCEKVANWNAVRYASSFWLQHLVKCNEPCRELLEELEEFCCKHIFHWLEVLSLIDYLSSLEGQLLQCITWCKIHALDNSDRESLAADVLYDTIRTLQTYYIPMRSHALQIYHSVFVTMPSCPLQQILAQGELPRPLPILVSPRASDWGPFTRILEGHGDVTSVVFSPDGTRIASGSHDRAVRIWNAVTFEELAKLEGHQGSVRCVTFSPDGTCIASGSDDETMRIWNAITFQEMAKLEGHQRSVTSVTFLPDGTHIVSGSYDRTIRIWNTVTFIELAKLEGHQNLITTVAPSLDGTRIASGSYDLTVRIWNIVTFEELAKLEGHKGPISSVTFSPDGTCIASGSYDRTVRIWNAVTFEELAQLKGHQGSIWSVIFSPDSTHIASGSSDHTVHIWNAVTFEGQAKLEGHQKSVSAVAFSPDGTQIASGSADTTVRIWEAVSFGKLINLDGHQGEISSVVFSPDGTRVASGSKDSIVHIWNAVAFKDLAKLEGYQDWVTSVAFSLDGTIISSQYQTGARRMWVYTASNDDVWTEVSSPESAPIMHHAAELTELTLTSSGWLESSATPGHPVLWLPLERRGSQIASAGLRVVVGGRTGAITILKLPVRPQTATQQRQTSVHHGGTSDNGARGRQA